MKCSLNQKHCRACKGEASNLPAEAIQTYLRQVSEWSQDQPSQHLQRQWTFKNFQTAMNWVNQVAELAESEGHHPDIHIRWNRVTLELYTHAVEGLTENDFIMAAKINQLPTRSEQDRP